MRAAIAASLAVAVGLTGASAAVAASAAAPAPADHAAAAGSAFTAFGVKGPAWRAVVKKGVLRVESPRLGTFRTKVSRAALATGVRFTGKRGRSTVALVVRGGACKDANGKNTGQVARLTVGKRTVTGCAVKGAVPLAGT